MTTKKGENVLSHVQLILPPKLRHGVEHNTLIFSRAVYPNARGKVFVFQVL